MYIVKLSIILAGYKKCSLLVQSGRAQNTPPPPHTHRRGKTYGSVRLRKKKSKGTLPIPDRAIEPWT